MSQQNFFINGARKQKILEDVRGFSSWPSAAFACAIVASYDRLNVRIEARLEAFGHALFEEIQKQNAPLGPQYFSEVVLGVLPDLVRRLMSVPILFKRKYEYRGASAYYWPPAGSPRPYSSDGVPSTTEGRSFTDAMYESYNRLNARRDAQYESELVRLSPDTLSTLRSVCESMTLPKSRLNELMFLAVDIDQCIAGKKTRKDAVDSIILACLAARGLTH